MHLVVDQSVDPHRGNESYRRVLWAVLAINAVMFAVEVAAGVAAGSASLQADALDFLGDAGNYAISLFVSFSEGTSLDARPNDARAFYATIAVATLLGVALSLVGLDPVQTLAAY